MDSLIGKKIGMTQIFDQAGNLIPVTVVEAGPCVVTQVKTIENDGYLAVQLGFGTNKKNNKPKKGHLKEATSRYLKEIRLKKTEELEVGQEIKAEIFNPGDIVSVTGNSIGKGFAGTIKKFHFSRGLMTHGSKSHRITGSIGAGTTPGRVLKGKKMPGRMGAVRVSVPSLTVVQVDPENNVVLLKGSVPGKPGSIIMINRTRAAKPAAAAKDKK
ncbi:50S ribosomal protein L3 [candidate division WOR-1 bacterium RIFOXYB2_FULL_42_35]|uniref:Large ribosomal subunit protein uL3 n=1 Tax=candidate division WOR-1 bacterium RIFOXYC2_FULL_41_25 TaxID=1802586 RepID=A0A1F4TMD2_UNCSA|nr:MAG: 50S ribosomal protein L3 [candidate division WOR-1 bacterium RIFOXYA2_FULL_41_14]OGC23854.1 MAG: 50S ribosomal protein L3 [candidate division WOR-1 bacterium RIFOXYB2_FULL_42_35]OGC33729.1 MAG: 50S ribosomal protein L3 [candidate division WOR-1 bacterium RIFOXYC2_FULL_41_25]OGC42928.1 MAG: 50S ribosomal protein L3 [candidate division WOR-1 bacterium RIFOXYD2_FULL_41_8]